MCSKIHHVTWILLCVLLVAPPATADDADPVLREFYPTGEYDLFVDGAKTDAEILFSRRAAAYVVAPAGNGRMFLLLQRQRRVASIPAKVIRRENGDVDLPKGVTPEPIGNLAPQGEDIVINAPTLRARLRPRPPLLGYHSPAGVFDHSPQYGLTMRAYRPDRQSIEALKNGPKAKVEVLFGTWCPRCKQTIGNALRVASELKESGVTFLFYGLPPPPDAWKNARFLETKIKALPTALVFVDDKVAGRISPNEWKNFEVSLRKLVTQ